jgi:hypothetical protein
MTEHGRQYESWLRAQREPRAWSIYRSTFPPVPPDHEDAVDRLALPARTQHALWRAGVDRISLLLDIMAGGRPYVRRIGDGGWSAIEAALDQPLPPLETPW